MISPRRLLAPLPLAAAAVAALAGSPEASAAEPWVDRPLTLPRHVWAFDGALGVGHQKADALFPARTGAGLNLEGAVGVTEDVELGFRLGVAFGTDAKTMGVVRPDAYGRLFDTETFHSGADTFTNPEARVRWRFVDGSFAQVGLEGRLYLPFATGSHLAIAPGLPIQLRFGSVARLDTGVNMPIVFSDPTRVAFSIPGRLWFQATDSLWLGPLSAVRIPTDGGDTSVLLGFGLGYQLAEAVDLKAQVYFPRITDVEGARDVGGGVGLELRIE